MTAPVLVTLDQAILARDTEGWLRGLVDQHGDNRYRAIFADWLAGHGDEPGAAGEMWAAENNKWPLKVKFYAMGGWYWERPTHPVIALPASCQLPFLPVGNAIISEIGSTADELLGCELALLVWCRRLDWSTGKPKLKDPS